MLVLGAFFVKPETEKNRFSFLTFGLSPLTSFFMGLRTKSNFTFSPQVSFQGKTYLRKGALPIMVTSVLITIGLLVVIIPLLASANPIFYRLVTEYINIEALLRWLIPDNYIIWIPRIIFFFILAFYLPRLFTYFLSGSETENKYFPSLESIHLLLPKIVISVVLVIFFVTQIQLYFSSPQSLAEMGYTLSRYAREVFAQLTIVSVIIMVLLYNDGNRSKWSQRLTYVLLVEVLFLVAMALKSVFDYSNSWGLTEKRLWGFTGVFWVIPIIGIYAYTYHNRIREAFFVKSIILFSALTLILVNIVNFDYLIYHFKKSTTESGIDYSYLSQLSPDSFAYAQLWNELSHDQNNVNSNSNYYYQAPRENVRYAIENLQRKYKNFDIRTFNLYEYIQYLDIHTIDTTKVKQSSYPATGIQPFPTPSNGGALETDGATYIKSRFGYEIKLLPSWVIHSEHPGYNEFEIARCSPIATDCAHRLSDQLALLSFSVVPDLNNGMQERSEGMNVQDWLATTQPDYWWDYNSKQAIPFTNTIVPVENDDIIVMRSMPYADSKNKNIYIPFKTKILTATLQITSPRKEDSEYILTEVKEILNSFRIH